MTVLLVDSKQTQDVETRITELMNMLPDIINSILNIDIVTKMAYNTLINFNDILKNNDLSKFQYLLVQ